MSTKKASTLQERFGFADPELTTPAHDTLMLWLDSQVEAFLTARTPPADTGIRVETDQEWGNYSIEPGAAEAARAAALAWWQDNPVLVSLNHFRRIWEKPIMNGNYMVGFYDLWLEATWEFTNAVPSVKVRRSFSEGNMTYVTGDIEAHDGYRQYHYGFEVKPSIRSIGEVVRQIRMYQEFTKGTKWLVVSPDDRFANTLEEQGIGFLKAPAA